jgi:hypothetical protein
VSIPAVTTVRGNAFAVSEKPFPELEGVHSVRVVFKGHSSNLSAIGFTPVWSGLDAPVASSEHTWALYTEGNTLHVEGLNGECVTLYDLAGKILYAGSPREEKITLPIGTGPGTWIVRIGETSVKVVLVNLETV